MTDEQLRRIVTEIYTLRYITQPSIKQRINELEEQVLKELRGPEEMPEIRNV